MPSSPSYRVQSVDILRGLIMVVMALDHTRDFFHITGVSADPLDTATTTTWLYFTRWFTHFCAPGFVFLSGLSAYLAAQKKTKQEASTFLIKRGLWLVLAEVTLVTLGLTFDPFFHLIILQVIWAIGWSMVILGMLSRWSYKAVLVAGLLLFFGHNIADYLHLPQEGTAADIWRLLLTSQGSIIVLNASHVAGAFYAILPWTGIMLLGYSMGKWFSKDFPAPKRRQLLVYTGTALIVLFIVLRFINHYGNPSPWTKHPDAWANVLAFLNTSKYPPSLQYACMTLGPSLLLLAAFEKARNKWSNVLMVYGNVPFFYYLLHFYVLHSLLVIVFFLTGHHSNEIATPNVPFNFRPVNFGYTLPVVYAIWAAVVFALYFPCRWYGNYKKTHHQWWLKYL